MVLSNSSVIEIPEGEPSLSFAPTNKTPGLLWFGKSLAKAQTACRALVEASPFQASFLSTISDSISTSKASSSLEFIY